LGFVARCRAAKSTYRAFNVMETLVKQKAQQQKYDPQTIDIKARELAAYREDAEKIKKLLPEKLKKDVLYAKHICTADPTLCSLFDPSVLASKELVRHVFKESVLNEETVPTFPELMRAKRKLEHFVNKLPPEHLEDKALVLELLLHHPDVVFNWSVTKYTDDEAYQKAVLEHLNLGELTNLLVSVAPSREFALKLSQKSCKNYAPLSTFFADDYEMALCAVQAKDAKYFPYHNLGPTIRKNPIKVATLISLSPFGAQLARWLEDDVVKIIQKAVKKISHTEKTLTQKANVFAAAQWLLQHHQAQNEQKRLKKVIGKTKTVESVAVTSDPFKNTL
jgi:hypothetical protein